MSIASKPHAHNRRVFIKLNNMDRTMKSSIHSALHEIGAENVRHTRLKIFKRKTGRIYVINNQFHQASAPHEAPANLSGELARHVDYIVRGHSQMEFGDKKQSGKAPIGKFLELGTIKMKPRPHIKTTVQEKYKDTQVSLVDWVRRGMKK